MKPAHSSPDPKDIYGDYLPQSQSEYPAADQNTYQAGYQPLSGPYESYSSQQEQATYQQQIPLSQPPFSTYQFVTGDVSKYERISLGMKARTAGVLCYLFSWVGGLIFFLLERQNRFVRFHAMQSIIFFGSLAILTGALSFFSWLAGILGTIGFIGWIVLIVAAGKGKYYKLPVIGEYAEKWAGLTKEPTRIG